MSSSLGRVICGVDYQLEQQANDLLRESRRGVTALSAKKDYFTEEQMANRLQHEVYNANGVPDSHIMSGLFRRSYNPLAGLRPTGLRPSEE